MQSSSENPIMVSSASSMPQPGAATKQCESCGKINDSNKNCANCKAVYYCDRDCQKAHWKQHKEACPMLASGESGASQRPLVVVLTLDKTKFYNDMYKDFNARLRLHANVEQATTPSEARALFNRDIKPAAVLSADESLTVSTRVSLVQEAASYVRSGGTLIFMGLFSSFSRPSDIATLFSKFGLPWSSGDYHRTTFTLNSAMTLLDKGGMASSYSQKALQVANVSPNNAVYLASSSSRVESAVFPPALVNDQTQSPAVFASVGAGKIGYVGDVNNEDDTTMVVLRMCGLGPRVR